MKRAIREAIIEVDFLEFIYRKLIRATMMSLLCIRNKIIPNLKVENAQIYLKGT